MKPSIASVRPARTKSQKASVIWPSSASQTTSGTEHRRAKLNRLGKLIKRTSSPPSTPSPSRRLDQADAPRRRRISDRHRGQFEIALGQGQLQLVLVADIGEIEHRLVLGQA